MILSVLFMVSSPVMMTSQDALAPGTHVVHEVLGEGVIVQYNETRDSYTVQFANGTRNIRRSFLKVK